MTTDFKVKKAYDGVNFECVKDKYVHILSLFALGLSQECIRQYFQHIGGIFHEILDCSQNQTTSLQIWKSFSLRKIKWILLFAIFATKIWRRSQVIESLKSETENTSGGIKARENLKNFQMHAMAFFMTITWVKTSTMRSTAKH